MHQFQSEEERLAWELTPQPGWLDSPFGPLFCWYHPAAEPARDRAVLLCDAIGSDRMNLHLAYRHMALQLSRAGYSTLRIDYPGTCDSGGTPRDGDRVEAWLTSLALGAEFLKAKSGVSELTVFGAFSGGTLAAAFASRRGDVTGLATWGPYLQGGDFLRSGRAMERLSASNPSGRKPAGWQEEDREFLGFLFTAATVAAIRDIDLAELSFASLRHACVMAADEGSKEEAFAGRLARLEVDVEYCSEPLDQGADSLQGQAVPHKVIGKVVSWLDDHSRTGMRTAAEEPAARQQVVVSPPDKAPAVLERCVRCGPDDCIFGIVTAPAAASAAQRALPALVLVNGGNNHRSGVNRNYTEWARRWASMGYTVLRFDIRGLGDSPPALARDLNVLYRPSTTSDVIDAMDFLQRTYGIQSFVAGGLCVGAFHALHAARIDKRIVGLWLLELLRFYEDETSIIARTMRPLRWLADRVRAIARIPRPPRPLGRYLDTLVRRGVRILTIYRADEKTLTLFRNEAANELLLLQDAKAFKLHLMDPCNHIFSPLWSQQEVRSVVENWLREGFGTSVEISGQGSGLEAQAARQR